MPQQSVITQEMRDAVGVDTEPTTYAVEAGAIKRFAEAIGDPNPLYSDEGAARQTRYGGIIAPPTFLRTMERFPPVIGVPIPYADVFDGGSDWEYFEPVRPGDHITATVRVGDIFERSGKLGRMLFIVRETRYVNQSDILVARQRNTTIHYDSGSREG